jgi:hypothetical protein
MLMCTRGVTGEKALEIQQIWPTPRHLVDAYLALKGFFARHTTGTHKHFEEYISKSKNVGLGGQCGDYVYPWCDGRKSP